MYKKIISALSILALTACSSIDVTETQSSKNIVENLDKNWVGEIQNSFDGELKEYNINVKNVMIQFQEDSYEDVAINIMGEFSIDSDDKYSAKSDIYLKLLGHSEVNEDNSTLKVKNVRTADIKFLNLYNSYAKDIRTSLKVSLDDISDLYLSKPNLLEFDGYTKVFSKFNKAKDVKFIKSNDGEKINIEFKEVE